MSHFLSETKINSIDSEHWHPPSFCRPIKKQPDPPAARVHSNPAATGRAHPVCVSRTLIHGSFFSAQPRVAPWANPPAHLRRAN
jgi:hypothetical protein